MYVNLNRDVQRLDSPGPVDRELREKALDIPRTLTPRSERPRKTWGSLAVSVQAVRGLCAKGKCFRQLDHEGDCYPK